MRSRRAFLKRLSVSGAAYPLYDRLVPDLRGEALNAEHGGSASLASLAGKVKITDLQIIPVTLPNARNTYVFVEILTDAGVKGLGEATLEGKPEATMGALRDLRHFLIGKDPTMIEHVWQAIYRFSFYRSGPVLSSALGGIDIALWDIQGKLLGVPIWKLLGGPTRERIRVYTHLGDEYPDRGAGRARELVAIGFRALKTFPQGSYEMVEGPSKIHKIVANLKGIREAVGENVDLMFDAHGDLYPSVSWQLARELEELHLLWIEEPTLPEDLDAMKKVQEKISVPIAAGERLFTIWGFRELLEKGIVDVVQPDIVHAGGISQVKKIAAMAEAHYVAVAPHNPLSPVATAACLHVDAAIPNFLIQEVVYGLSARNAMVNEPIERVSDGYIELPRKPGLGVELNHDIIRQYGYRHPEFEEVYRPDGSVGEN